MSKTGDDSIFAPRFAFSDALLYLIANSEHHCLQFGIVIVLGKLGNQKKKEKKNLNFNCF